MGLLLLEVVGKPDSYPVSSGYCNMQIFVKRLWRTETFGIDGTETQITERTVADIDPWREYRPADEIMFVNTDTTKNSPVFVLPFVLEISAEDIYLLGRFIVISE